MTLLFLNIFKQIELDINVNPDVINYILNNLERTWKTLINEMDFENEMLLITSDHGNIEDISKKSHTKNPVPLLVFTKNEE